jgi:ribosomal-protein-alanine N-acetyltransferase
MRRREADFERDYPRLLEMDRLSSEINFPGDPFCEDAFRVSLRSDVRHGDVYIYEDDEGLIGWLWLDIDVRHHSAHIKHIQVEQARWGQGYGRRIVQDAMAIAGHAACRVLTLNVTKSNARAMALYAGLGFEIAQDQNARQRMRLLLPPAAPPNEESL